MEQPIHERWEDLYEQIPLCEVPGHYAAMQRSPFLQEYLGQVLARCPRGGRSCEAGVGSGYGTIWLSQRGVCAEGIDNAPRLVERARQVNNVLGGRAVFREADLFCLFEDHRKRGAFDRYHVIHHQGVLEHMAAPSIRAALAQQVACAKWVVFSVPSVYYPFPAEFGDERLLRLEDWQRILLPFEDVTLRYYGDPALGEREHILGVLRGQAVDDALLALMAVPDEPYPAGISALVHTRNEGAQIADCLETLAGWTDEIIVCDMESSDDTVRIAHQYTENILNHPLVANFDQARNVSAARAQYRWVFYLDADERVPARLGPHLRDLISAQGDQFEALLLPFRHHFAGRWMQSLYPGYTAPRLLKNGRFVFRARLHAGAHVDGRLAQFPADDPALAIVHHSYKSLAHYLDKLNRYTDGEASNLHRDGSPFHWQHAVGHFVEDFQAYYDRGGASRDGVHGFLYAFLSGFYRFEQHAKLYERRFRQGELHPGEADVPASVEQVLEFALAAARRRPAASSLRIARAVPDGTGASGAAPVVWSGPLLDSSGYGEDCRHLLWALDAALLEARGPSVAAQPLPWSNDQVDLDEDRRARLQALSHQTAAPGFIQVIQSFPPAFVRHPDAGVVIGRTMFETDRLPADWVEACNGMDYVWVPSEFNRQTFAQAGVEAGKLVVIPNCFDPAEFAEDPTPLGPVDAEAEPAEQPNAAPSFVFLSVFDWTRHKGWDVLLRAFLEEFDPAEDVRLVLKVWSTLGHGPKGISDQATEFCRQELGRVLPDAPRVQFITERLSRAGLRALYQASDAFVLPSRGEGWGRPYMEAMACGKPVIGTNWSGNTAFMTTENSYLLDYVLEAVPEEGWQEVPAYRGHRWAEPDAGHLKRLLRHVFTQREAAAAVGERARTDVRSRFSQARVGRLVADELSRVQQERGGPLITIEAAPEYGPGERSAE